MVKAINICLQEAEEMEKLHSNTVLISINDEYCEPSKLRLDRTKSNVLTVTFTDITSEIEHKGKIYKPISKETALKILDFININKDKNFIVHCTAGVSRSSAVCLYLHHVHGHELRDSFWSLSEPNPFVLGTLIVERKRKVSIF